MNDFEPKTKYPLIFLTDTDTVLLTLSELADMTQTRVRSVLRDTGAEKVNLVAWSRWGLAARMLASVRPELIASVSTVGTPHMGLRVLDSFAAGLVDRCWAKAAKRGRDELSKAAEVLTPERMSAFNAAYPDRPGVFYQSRACAMKPEDEPALAAANRLISIFDGENDGAVSVYSALWGQVGKVCRGYSHISAAPELYSDVVSTLFERGL